MTIEAEAATDRDAIVVHLVSKPRRAQTFPTRSANTCSERKKGNDGRCVG